ncbi:DUF1707 SHOCT-like domain-containing protein [Williamsia sterculiae]|uniref:DUF1707 domain-containing protein n=1 Tax=Williamsia sterculiae TaxID=1344003 RepID=A0A1N7DHJ3_9NOCA|nr:DUF1707 domain-containing protein [Williamsia sterculiae]SIR75271.1 protein of unknown function [Williamsia sterculiae]
MVDSDDGDMRAGDVDRASALADLDLAFVAGQLDVTEHVERLERARSARTLAELASLTSDLRIPRAPVPPPPRHPLVASPWALALAGALMVVAICIAAGVFTTDVENRRPDRPVDPMVAGELFTAHGIAEVVQRTRERFHTTVVEGIHLYRDEAELHVIDPSSPTGGVHYQYSPGGDFHSPEVYSGLAVDSGLPNESVDLADVDTERVADVIASAPERLGIGTPQDAGPAFRVTIGGDDGGEIWIGVNGVSIDSHMVTRLDGTVKGVHRCGWGC